MPMLVAGALGYAALTQLIGLHAAVGAFLFGTVFPRDSAVVGDVRLHQLRGFALMALITTAATSATIRLLGNEKYHHRGQRSTPYPQSFKAGSYG